MSVGADQNGTRRKFRAQKRTAAKAAEMERRIEEIRTFLWQGRGSPSAYIAAKEMADAWGLPPNVQKQLRLIR
jgi:hypothetical protein